MAISIFTSEVLSLLYLTVDVPKEDWLGKYTHVGLFRSILGASGPYVELTAPAYGPAALSTQVLSSSLTIVGKSLTMVFNGNIYCTVTFSGSDPLSLAAIVTQMNAAFAPYATAVQAAGIISIMTVLPGGNSSLQVVGGDAAAILGILMNPNPVYYGNDARVPLLEVVPRYSFTDYFSTPESFYEIGYFNQGIAGPTGDPFQGKDVSILTTSDNLVIGQVDLIQANGRPSDSIEVNVYQSGQMYQSGVYAITGAPIRGLTDSKGHFEVPLLRGMQINLSIGTSGLMRVVNVPTDPAITRFGLLDPTYGVDDAFDVQRPAIPYANRTTL